MTPPYDDPLYHPGVYHPRRPVRGRKRYSGAPRSPSVRPGLYHLPDFRTAPSRDEWRDLQEYDYHYRPEGGRGADDPGEVEPMGTTGEVQERMGMRDLTERYGRYSGGSPYSYEYSERTIYHRPHRPGTIGFTRYLDQGGCPGDYQEPWFADEWGREGGYRSEPMRSRRAMGSGPRRFRRRLGRPIAGNLPHGAPRPYSRRWPR